MSEQTKTRRATLVCEIDDTLRINDSGIILSEMLGAPAVLVPIRQDTAGWNSLERCQ